MRVLKKKIKMKKKKDQYISIDGTIWKKIQIDTAPERAALHNIFWEESDLMAYANCNFGLDMINQKSRKYTT